MPGGGDSESKARAVVYCVVPRDLAARLHEPLRRHFGDDPAVEVIVERRGAERRGAADRRRSGEAAPAAERRRIHGAGGRRVGDRRAAVSAVAPPELPRRARPHAERLAFVERLEPSTERAEDLDSARLVTRFQAGDREAFATLYMRYFDRVFSYLRVALKDPLEAEDMTQEVFTEALEALPGYERRRRPFRAWLFVIVRNSAIDYLRKSGRVELEDAATINRRREQATADPVEPDVPDWLSDRDLVVLIERLPLAQRQVLVLRYLFDLRVREIAELLGYTANHVSVLQHRALGFLRARLARLGRGAPDDRAPRMRRRVPQAQVLRTRRFALLP